MIGKSGSTVLYYAFAMGALLYTGQGNGMQRQAPASGAPGEARQTLVPGPDSAALTSDVRPAAPPILFGAYRRALDAAVARAKAAEARAEAAEKELERLRARLAEEEPSRLRDTRNFR